MHTILPGVNDMGRIQDTDMAHAHSRACFFLYSDLTLHMFFSYDIEIRAGPSSESSAARQCFVLCASQRHRAISFTTRVWGIIGTGGEKKSS